MDAQSRQGKKKAASASRTDHFLKVEFSCLEFECGLEFQCRVGSDIGQSELETGV